MTYGVYFVTKKELGDVVQAFEEIGFREVRPRTHWYMREELRAALNPDVDYRAFWEEGKVGVHFVDFSSQEPMQTPTSQYREAYHHLKNRLGDIRHMTATRLTEEPLALRD